MRVTEELLLGDSLSTDLTQTALPRRDRLKVEEQLDSLAAMEAVCLIWMEYSDLKNVLGTINHQQWAVQSTLRSVNKLDFALSAQRLLFTIVAAIARENLLQRYTMLGLPTLAYAWAKDLSTLPEDVISDAYN